MTIASDNDDITEDEMAVCLAAVMAYMATSEPATAPKQNISHWLASARLESLGHASTHRHLPDSAASNIWRATNLPIIASLVLLSLTVLIQPNSAVAQNYSPGAQYSSPAGNVQPASDIVNNQDENYDQNTSSGVYDLYRAAALRRKTIAAQPAPGNYRADTAFRPSGAQTPTFAADRSDSLWATQGVAPTNTSGTSEQVAQSSATTSQTLIRVALVLGADKLQVTVPDGAEIFDLQTNNILARMPENSRFHAQSSPGQTLFVLDQSGTSSALPQLANATTSGSDADPITQVSYTPLTPPTLPPSSFSLANSASGGCLVLATKEDGVILVNGKPYRGGVRISADAKGRLKAINVVNVEDYLLSVVPSEMPSQWSQEALKAQAIAARSYALANISKHDSDGYDVKANTEDQVYAGCAAESDQTNLAVAQTEGLVLKQNNQIITAYFHSGSGGYTEEPDSFNGTPTPFLHAVPDYDDASPLFSWSQSFTLSKLEDCLRNNGHDTGNLLDIMIVSRTPANRVKQVLLIGTSTCQMVDADELRRVFKLPSTNFNVGATSDSYIFAGHGFGHGLGLSQWGAKELAEHGYNAAQILKYYYKDVTIERL